MNDYLEVLSSVNVKGFYPVPAGSSLASATGVLHADPDVTPDVIAALPDPGADYEWYVDNGNGGTAPTTPTTPTDPAAPIDPTDQAGEDNPTYYTVG